MPHLDHTGPESKGPKTGRKLGLCKKKDGETTGTLGVGLGSHRKSCTGNGKGKRLNSGKQQE